MSTVENNIMYNMYNQGNLDTNDHHSVYTSLDKDYYIKCYREKINPLWISNPYAGRNYKCHLIFYNNLNIELLHLILSELDIFTILYNFNSFYPDGVYSIPLGSGYHSTTSIDYEYSFLLDFDYKEYSTSDKFDTNYNDNFYLYISEFSKVHQVVNNKFKIRFNEDALIDFTDLLFFVFLIDIIDTPEYKYYYDQIYEYL